LDPNQQTSAQQTNNGAPSPAPAPASAPAPAPAAAPAPASEGQQQSPQAAAPAPAAAAPASAPAPAPASDQEGNKPDELTAEMYESLVLPEEVGMGADNIKALAQVAMSSGVKPEAVQALVQAHAENIKAQQEQWSIATANDELVGGEQMEQKLAVAVKGLKAYGDDEVSKLLKQTPLGTHPAIVRLLYRAGLTVQEDSTLVGGSPPAGKKSAADILFG